MARLVLNLLGTFQATLDGRPVDGFDYDKVRALLAYLAVESDRPHRREKLVGLLWPGYPESSARRSLAQALYLLRNALGDREAEVPFLLVTPQAIQFNRASDARLDVDTFQAAVERGGLCDLEEAVAAYRGRFLSGLLLEGCPVYDEWVALKREALHERAVDALHRLAGEYEKERELGKALRVARQQVALDPYWEAGHRTLMRLLVLKGQRNAALAHYEELRALLTAELGVEPEPETTRLYEQIRAAAEGTVVERAGAALQGVVERVKRDRAYQIRLGAMTVVMLTVVVVVALLWLRPRGPRPRDPTMTDLPDGRPVGALSLWPEINLQSSTTNPLVRTRPDGAEEELVLAPTVVLYEGRHYFLATCAEDWPDGPAHIGYAKSPGGGVIRVQDLLGSPKLEGDGEGFDAWSVGMPVLVQDGAAWLLYYAGDESGPFGEGLAIGRATTRDLDGAWTRDAEPVLEPGGPGEWDSCSVAPAAVVVTDHGYNLYYVGSSRGDCDRWMIGMATSRDGIRWTKHDDPATQESPYAASDPVLTPGGPDEWDGRSLPGAAIRDTGLGWEMFYTGESAAGRRVVGYAWSKDGRAWDKRPGNPILGPEDDPVAADALQVHAVVVYGPTYEIYYDYGLSNELGRARGTVRWAIVVDTVDDELNRDGDCSLREAIEAANRDEGVDACPAGDGLDRVIIPAGTYVLTLHGAKEDNNRQGDLDVLADLTLEGAGAGLTILDGDGADRVLHNHGATVVINDLTVTNGWVSPDDMWGGGTRSDSGLMTINRCTISHNTASFGGGLHNNPGAGTVARMAVNDTLVISNTATGNGGGIMNLAEPGSPDSTAILTVTRCSLVGNVADGSLRGVAAGWGGGMASGINVRSEGSVAVVTIRDSTVSGNVAGGTGSQMGMGGGLLMTAGELTIINSTISGNSAMGEGPLSGAGGGAWISTGQAPGTLTLVNSTVADNLSAAGGGGLAAMSMACVCGDMSDPNGMCFGLELHLEGPEVVLHNTIIGNNTAPADAGCALCESTVVSNGYNLEDGATCALDQPTDLADTDPLLGPLADNGGPTRTHAPLAGSPVVDAGNCGDSTTDQRGYPRPMDIPNAPNVADGCDIGAVEVHVD